MVLRITDELQREAKKGGPTRRRGAVMALTFPSCIEEGQEQGQEEMLCASESFFFSRKRGLMNAQYHDNQYAAQSSARKLLFCISPSPSHYLIYGPTHYHQHPYASKLHLDKIWSCLQPIFPSNGLYQDGDATSLSAELALRGV
ncbi:hypothetical protein GOP47_0025301 [Adiantum capillus-veneris]|uniref:Uncharacterized protein n=1 Tax=Adiantum capillus-veneris TaxID=13818 RepID=A0A9D4U0J3_ADICA|nr:hypothetical protein GOP47_0025301 [Adiantum capillus-veneris]